MEKLGITLQSNGKKIAHLDPETDRLYLCIKLLSKAVNTSLSSRESKRLMLNGDDITFQFVEIGMEKFYWINSIQSYFREYPRVVSELEGLEKIVREQISNYSYPKIQH